MKTVRKSVLIWYSPAEMFRLVSNVESYPAFLPWCGSGKVLEKTPDGMVAEVGISLAGFKQTFVTRNHEIPDRQIDLDLVRGPFSDLHGQWRFEPVGDGQQRACRIHFELQYGFSSRTLAALVGPVFDKIAGSFVDAFLQQAKKVYG